MPFDIHKSKLVVVDMLEKVLVKHKHLLFFEPSLAKSLVKKFFKKERQCEDSIVKKIVSTMDYPKDVQANDF
jgi:hypothetical protein